MVTKFQHKRSFLTKNFVILLILLYLGFRSFYSLFFFTLVRDSPQRRTSEGTRLGNQQYLVQAPDSPLIYVSCLVFQEPKKIVYNQEEFLEIITHCFKHLLRF